MVVLPGITTIELLFMKLVSIRLVENVITLTILGEFALEMVLYGYLFVLMKIFLLLLMLQIILLEAVERILNIFQLQILLNIGQVQQLFGHKAQIVIALDFLKEALMMLLLRLMLLMEMNSLCMLNYYVHCWRC